jgi:Protein of unknown function (DUF3667)
MSGEVEAVADIATGAALAQSVEPDAGTSGTAGATACLNCGQALVGRHCHNCGQKAAVQRSLAAFGHDILHSVLHFDGKIWRTLPMLAWDPGHLTRRYVHGERAKFVSPLALFLFSVFLTFAVFSLAKLGPTTNFGTKADSKTQLETTESAKRVHQELISNFETMKKDRPSQGGDASDIADDIAVFDEQIAVQKKAIQEIDEETLPEIRGKISAEQKFETDQQEGQAKLRQLESDLAKAKASGAPTAQIEDDIEGIKQTLLLSQKARDLIKTGQADMSDVNINLFGIESLNAAAKHALENPQLLLYKVQSNLYKFSWMLIPISVPFVWLLFFSRRQFKLFDHAVFVTYSLCFMMVLILVSAILIASEMTEVIGALMLGLLPPLHMYRQLKQAYGLTRLSALWRTALLNVFAVVSLTAFVTMILAIGVTG